jgi:hypothetical protein
MDKNQPYCTAFELQKAKLHPIALPDLILDPVTDSIQIGPLETHPFWGIRNEEYEEAT